MNPEPAAPINHRQIALDHFGIEGTASPLPGYEDSNALISTPNGERYVLKVSPPDPDLERIRFGVEAMKVVQAASFEAPFPLLSASGTPIASLPNSRYARLLTWVAGATAESAGRPSAAARSIGRTAGEMVSVLMPLKQRVPHDDATWDPGHVPTIITRYHHNVDDNDQHSLVERVLTALDAVPFDRLPEQTIHSDLNAGNVILTDGSVTGVIDFEDVVSTIRIGELSAACAYAMLTQDDPMAVAMDVIAGYRELMPITSLEAEHLYLLTLSRMAVSVCIAASQPPGNPHQHRTSELNWALLTRLLSGDSDELGTRFRAAALS